MRLCQYCQRPLSSRLRADALFCGQNCRRSAYRHAIWAGITLSAPSPELIALRDALLACSQHFMIGYSLGFTDGEQQPVWLPPTQQRSKRYDGSFDDRPYFELRPKFEIPRVPQVGIYHVEFVCNDHMRVPAPNNLSGGIYVPVASPMCLPGKKNISRRRPRQNF